MSRPDHYWLHVPLETMPGLLLEAPPDRRVTVLGCGAKLLEREPYISFMTASALVIKQWILFDAIPEGEASRLLADLRARVPVLSMNMGANFRIPAGDLNFVSNAAYDGTRPTLIPADLTPAPVWDDSAGSCIWKARDVLEGTLADCPPVTDERVRAAVDLFIASQYDFLPRSLYLAMLTILDALATPAKRRGDAAAWIDRIVGEARSFDDPSLVSAVGNLKRESQTTAIRHLVGRAVRSLGGGETEADRQAHAVGDLYRARSKLSHEGFAVGLDLALATNLARLVINAAVRNPSLLDVDAGEHASVESGRHQRAQWIAEAEAVIRKVEPGCAAVVSAIRRPLVMGPLGLLTARLADGREWVIGEGVARPLSDNETTDWAAHDESFGTRIHP
jgi:hypothetical protein